MGTWATRARLGPRVCGPSSKATFLPGTMAARAAARGPPAPCATSSKRLFKSHPETQKCLHAAALPPTGLAGKIGTLFAMHPIWTAACRGGALGVSLHLWALALICTHKRNVLTALQVGCSHYRAALSALPHILTEFLFPTSLPQPQATDSPQALFTQDPGAS